MKRRLSQLELPSASGSSYHTSQNISEAETEDEPGESQVVDPSRVLFDRLVHLDQLQEKRLTMIESGELSRVLEKQRARATSAGWCLNHILATTKAEGYAQVSIGGRKDFTVNELVAWESLRLDFQRKIEIGESLAEKVQASHLCGNRKCIQQGHIIWESVRANNERKGCLAYLELSSGKLVPCCEHKPVCIKSLEGHTFDSIYKRDSDGQLEFNIDDRWETVARRAIRQ